MQDVFFLMLWPCPDPNVQLDTQINNLDCFEGTDFVRIKRAAVDSAERRSAEQWLHRNTSSFYRSFTVFHNF